MYGAVKEEGVYPLIRGKNSALNLLALAGGVKDGAFLGSVEVRRRYVQENVVRNTIETIDLANEIGYEPQASDEMRCCCSWRDRGQLT